MKRPILALVLGVAALVWGATDQVVNGLELVGYPLTVLGLVGVVFTRRAS